MLRFSTLPWQRDGISRGISMSFKLKEILHDIEGATAVEYSLIAALFVMGTIAGLNGLGSPLQNMLKVVLTVVLDVVALAQ